MQGEEEKKREKSNSKEMNRAEVRRDSSKYQGRSYKDWWEVYSNMGAKNTENMTQASERENKTSKMKMCIVSCLGWIF